MKHGMKNMAALLAFLAFAAVAALTVGAQTPQAHEIGFSDLPESRPAYTPHSAIFKATMGTITADADRFMSVLDFSSLSAQKWFAYAGVDESIKDGLNFGFGTKFGEGGKNYFGVAYSGDLINEVVGLFTNQSVAGFKLVTPEDTAGVTKPYLADADGDPVSDGKYTSNHNLHFLFGRGMFGAKVGFSEFIQGAYYGDEKAILESSLKPFLELGINVGEGARFKAALRGAIDIHQYNGFTSDTELTDNVTPGTFAYYTTQKQNRMDFLEPSGGITLGVDFSKSEKTQMEADLIADIVYRMYTTDGTPGLVKSTWAEGAALPTPPTLTTPSAIYESSSITDMRIPGSIGFTYRNDLNEKFTLGFNTKLGGGFELLSITQEETKAGTEYESTETRLSVTPDVAAGVSYTPWRDHFALHGGLGLQLFSVEMLTKTVDSAGTSTSDTTSGIEIPIVRLALGMTVNFTENTALDLLVAARNVAELTNTKFTMLFSVKK